MCIKLICLILLINASPGFASHEKRAFDKVIHKKFIPHIIIVPHTEPQFIPYARLENLTHQEIRALNLKTTQASPQYQPRKKDAAVQTDPCITTLSTNVESATSKDKFEGYTLYAPRWPYIKQFIKCPNDIDPTKEVIPDPTTSNIGKQLPVYSLAALASMGFRLNQPKDAFEPGEIVLTREFHDHIWWSYGTVSQIMGKSFRDFGERDEDEYSVNVGAGYGVILKSAMIIKYPLSSIAQQSNQAAAASASSSSAHCLPEKDKK